MIYRFRAIATKIPASFFVEIDKLIQKFVQKCKIPRRAKTILKKKNKVRGLMLPDFKSYCKAIVIRILWTWHKDRHLNQ